MTEHSSGLSYFGFAAGSDHDRAEVTLFRVLPLTTTTFMQPQTHQEFLHSQVRPMDRYFGLGIHERCHVLMWAYPGRFMPTVVLDGLAIDIRTK